MPKVFKEYVVVLVSNGKCQSEAKAELEPFLGDSTTEIVSWLWDILLEITSCDSNANMSSSYLENITAASSTEADDASIKNQSQHCGSGVAKSHHVQFPVFPNTLGEETYNRNASALSCKSNENYRAFENCKNNQDGSLNGCSFRTKPSAEILLADEQHLQYEKVHERSPPYKRAQETNVGGRRLFSRAAGAIFLQKVINGTTRGNVWDRLGMVTENDTSLKVKKVKANGGDNIQRQTLEQISPGPSQNTLMPPVEDNKVKQNLSQNCYVKTYRSSGAQKRQLNDFIPISGSTSESLDCEEENCSKFRRQTKKYAYILKESCASCNSEKSKSDNKCCTSDYDASIRSRPGKISQENVEALESTQTPISHSALPAATGRTGPLQAQLVDMKFRLRQLETEISKLKTKPVNNGGNIPYPLALVHFAATQAALRSYFATCGAIVRVILLTDTSTIKQKWFRSAYITFTTMESVDKALALNGTYFFSRIIWVIVRKSSCTSSFMLALGG
ncbi:hypothetical protein DITRI_Ditri10aG0170600 [Diplodiscus trichospermus]